jgi:BRCT domain type II-containing protein
MSDQKPKNVNRMGDLKPKNLNVNEELKAKSDSNKPQSKPMRTPHQESNHSRRKTKAPPPAAVKKVSNRNSASSTTPTSTTSTTTKSPFAAKVRERLPGLMQSLSNHASWVNRAWDLGAAAA